MPVASAGARFDLKRRVAFGAACSVLAMGLTGGSMFPAAVAEEGCDLDPGLLAPGELPEGSSVIDCNAVGRVITAEGTGVTIPEPGEFVTVVSVEEGGEAGFTVAVAQDGTIEYSGLSARALDSASASGTPATSEEAPGPDVPDAPVDDSDVDPVDSPDAAAETAGSPVKCSDDAYNLLDYKVYDEYRWYLGDGANPAGLGDRAARRAFAYAIAGITDQRTNCDDYPVDRVGAEAEYQGKTTYEADISSSTECLDRDEKSTWDAGNLDGGTIAAACLWGNLSIGTPDHVVEADVRYNTVDKDFTNVVLSDCEDRFDVKAIGTHEAGHVFGLDHVGSGHENLTMFKSGTRCSSKWRWLGKGDVLAARARY